MTNLVVEVSNPNGNWDAVSSYDSKGSYASSRQKGRILTGRQMANEDCRIFSAKSGYDRPARIVETSA